MILEDLGELYITEIVREHRVPVSIMSDRDVYFVAMFLKCLYKTLVTTLNVNTAYHPWIDGQFKEMIQN